MSLIVVLLLLNDFSFVFYVHLVIVYAYIVHISNYIVYVESAVIRELCALFGVSHDSFSVHQTMRCFSSFVRDSTYFADLFLIFFVSLAVFFPLVRMKFLPANDENMLLLHTCRNIHSFHSIHRLRWLMLQWQKTMSFGFATVRLTLSHNSSRKIDTNVLFFFLLLGGM